MSETFKPTHYFVAQAVRLLEHKDGKFLVQFEDLSQGWKEGPLLPRTMVDAFIMWGDNRHLNK